MGNIQSAEDDLKTYRDGYPDLKDDPDKKKNGLFYTGKIESQPNGDFIDNLHKNWWEAHELLEEHHGYIQWLFPIREDGMNFRSQALQLHEIETIKSDKKALARFIRSYELMLHFYGMRLVKNSETPGEIERDDNWKERYHNLNHSFHNYLRVTRILKSLGELGFENYKKPFLLFVFNEIYVNKQLVNAKRSAKKYWGPSLRVEEDRLELIKKINVWEGRKEDDNGADSDEERSHFFGRNIRQWDDSDDDDDDNDMNGNTQSDDEMNRHYGTNGNKLGEWLHNQQSTSDDEGNKKNKGKQKRTDGHIGGMGNKLADFERSHTDNDSDKAQNSSPKEDITDADGEENEEAIGEVKVNADMDDIDD